MRRVVLYLGLIFCIVWQKNIQGNHQNLRESLQEFTQGVDVEKTVLQQYLDALLAQVGDLENHMHEMLEHNYGQKVPLEHSYTEYSCGGMDAAWYQAIIDSLRQEFTLLKDELKNLHAELAKKCRIEREVVIKNQLPAVCKFEEQLAGLDAKITTLGNLFFSSLYTVIAENKRLACLVRKLSSRMDHFEEKVDSLLKPYGED